VELHPGEMSRSTEEVMRTGNLPESRERPRHAHTVTKATLLIRPVLIGLISD